MKRLFHDIINYMVKFEPHFIQSFIAINQFFQKYKFRYCLIGGIAAGYWGEPRYTQDADFTVVSHGGSFKEILQLLSKEKFKAEKKGESQVKVTHFKNKSCQADLILAEIPYQDWLVQRATPVKVFEVTVPVCALEDLIILKLIANRRQDLLDIEKVLEKNTKLLDKKYLHEWLEFWNVKARFLEEFGAQFPKLLEY